MSERLFSSVVMASRLSDVVGSYAIARLLLNAEVSPRDVTPEGLERALPRIEAGLAVYLRGDELEAAVRDVRSLVAQA